MIDVASAVDAANLAQVAVVAASIAASAPPWRRIRYHVLYCGEDSPLAHRLDGLRQGGVTMMLHRVPTPVPAAGTIGHVSAASYLRLILPSVLSEVRRVIYLDADTLVMRDLGLLYRARLAPGHPIGAVVDYGMVRDALAHPDLDSLVAYFRETGLPGPLDGRYVNTGVLLLDLEALRREGFEARSVAMAREHDLRLRWRDQDVINHLLNGRITFIDPRWNVMVPIAFKPNRLADPEHQRGLELQRRQPYILHFTHLWKPWHADLVPEQVATWWFFARRSAAHQELHDIFGGGRFDPARPPPRLVGGARIPYVARWLRLKYFARPVLAG